MSLVVQPGVYIDYCGSKKAEFSRQAEACQYSGTAYNCFAGLSDVLP